MVKGLREFERKLMAIPRRVERAARAAMEKGADELVAMMKRLAPVDDGTLRDSIGWTWGDAPAGSVLLSQSEPDSRGLKITVYAGNAEAYYAHWVEFGTAPHNVADGGGTKAGKESLRTGRLTKKGAAPVFHPGAAAHPFFFPAWRALRKRIRSRIRREMKKAIKFVGPDLQE